MRKYVYGCPDCGKITSTISCMDTPYVSGQACEDTECCGWAKPLKVDKNGNIYFDEY